MRSGGFRGCTCMQQTRLRAGPRGDPSVHLRLLPCCRRLEPALSDAALTSLTMVTSFSECAAALRAAKAILTAQRCGTGTTLKGGCIKGMTLGVFAGQAEFGASPSQVSAWYEKVWAGAWTSPAHQHHAETMEPSSGQRWHIKRIIKRFGRGLCPSELTVGQAVEHFTGGCRVGMHHHHALNLTITRVSTATTSKY